MPKFTKLLEVEKFHVVLVEEGGGRFLELFHVSYDLDRGWPTVTEISQTNVEGAETPTTREAVKLLCDTLAEKLTG